MCIRYYRERLFPIFGRKLTSDDGDAIYDYEMECEEAMELNYRNVNGYLLPELEYKSGEQMTQLGKYGFLRRDYLKNHKWAKYQVMLLQLLKQDLYFHRKMGQSLLLKLSLNSHP